MPSCQLWLDKWQVERLRLGLLRSCEKFLILRGAIHFLLEGEDLYYNPSIWPLYSKMQLYYHFDNMQALLQLTTSDLEVFLVTAKFRMVLALVGFYEYEVVANQQPTIKWTFSCQLDLAGFYEFRPWKIVYLCQFMVQCNKLHNLKIFQIFLCDIILKCTSPTILLSQSVQH